MRLQVICKIKPWHTETEKERGMKNDTAEKGHSWAPRDRFWETNQSMLVGPQEGKKSWKQKTPWKMGHWKLETSWKSVSRTNRPYGSLYDGPQGSPGPTVHTFVLFPLTCTRVSLCDQQNIAEAMLSHFQDWVIKDRLQLPSGSQSLSLSLSLINCSKGWFRTSQQRYWKLEENDTTQHSNWKLLSV